MAGVRPAISGAALAIAPWAIVASGETNLQLTNNLVWVMVGISTSGSIITFAFLVYALWKFRDPAVRGRRYG
ncbi:MAG TPA: hypothetical protein VMG36_08325 [Thermoplasmata archaeon]|nr:hypothetical protein [Thermoplasmata archaeon]